MAVATDVAMATIGVMTAEVMAITVVMMVAVTRDVALGIILAMTVAATAAGDMAITAVMTAAVMQGAVILVMAVGDNAPFMGCPPIAAGAMPAAIAATRPLLAIAVTLAMAATADFAATKG